MDQMQLPKMENNFRFFFLQNLIKIYHHSAKDTEAAFHSLQKFWVTAMASCSDWQELWSCDLDFGFWLFWIQLMTEHLILSILYRLYIYIYLYVYVNCLETYLSEPEFDCIGVPHRDHGELPWDPMGNLSSRFNTACHHLAGTNTISPGSWMNLSAIFLLVFPKVWGEFHEVKRLKPWKPETKFRYLRNFMCFFLWGKFIHG